MPRIELFARPDCPDGRQLADWLAGHGHACLWRNLSDPAVAEDLRSRTGLGIAPVTVVDGRAVWGTAREQQHRLHRLLRRPRRWTLAWWRD